MKRRPLALGGALPRAALLVAAAASLTALGADCEGNVVQDPTFRDWCGSSLCAWTLDSGRIQRVATWNPDDFGVAFLDAGTQISQVTQENQATCLLFKTVADIDPEAQMTLLVDFNNDDTIDFQGPLGATDWHQVQAGDLGAPRVQRHHVPPAKGGLRDRRSRRDAGPVDDRVHARSPARPAPGPPRRPVRESGRLLEGSRLRQRRPLRAVRRRRAVPRRALLRYGRVPGAPLRPRAGRGEVRRSMRAPR